MTLFTSITNLFCKKRKSSQPSDISSPQNSERDQSPNSSKIDESRSTSRSSQPAQDGSDDQLKESIQTQPILDSENEAYESETEHIQQSFELKVKISAAIPSSMKKGHVTITKGDRHEKVALFQPNNPNGHREEVQARAGRHPNNEGRLQERMEIRNTTTGHANNQRNIMIGATNAQREDEMMFSNELSYQSKASVVSLTELNQIEQSRSVIVSKEEMKKKALEDLEKFNYAAIGVTKEGAMSKRYKKEKSDLYVEFCNKAEVHPIVYYRNTNKEIFTKGNLEDRIKTLLEKDGFEINGLVFTKEGLPHKTHTNKNIKNWLVKYGYYDVVIQETQE